MKRKRNKGSESPIIETVSTLAPNAIPSDRVRPQWEGLSPGRRVVETRGYDGPRHRKGPISMELLVTRMVRNSDRGQYDADARHVAADCWDGGPSPGGKPTMLLRA